MIGRAHKARSSPGACLGPTGLARGQRNNPKAGGAGFGFADDIIRVRCRISPAPSLKRQPPSELRLSVAGSRFLSCSIAKL